MKMFKEMDKTELIGAILLIVGIVILIVPLIVGSFIIHPVLGCVVLGVVFIIIGGFIVSECNDV